MKSTYYIFIDILDTYFTKSEFNYLPGFRTTSGSPNKIGTNIFGHRTAKHPNTMLPIRIVFPVESPPSVAMTSLELSRIDLTR